MNNQRHLLKLENCTCGALQYIIIRDRKKTSNVYLLHIAEGKQSMKLLTKISKKLYEFHFIGQREASNLDNLTLATKKFEREVTSIITEMKKRKNDSS